VGIPSTFAELDLEPTGHRGLAGAMSTALKQLLLRQRQVVHRHQVLQLGVSVSDVDRWVREGTWTSLLPSVYLAQPELLLTQSAANRARATQLWGGKGAVLCERTAMWWWGWSPEPPNPLVVSVPTSRRLSRQPGIVVRRIDRHPSDITRVRGVVITTAARTAVDLAALGCTDLLDLMLRDGWFDLGTLMPALERGRGRHGWAAARRALTESTLRPFSAAERVMHRGLRRAGITGWVANPQLRIDGTVIIPDLLFLAGKLIVEIDGYAFHSSRSAFEVDRTRQNLLVAAGYRVLRVTWQRLLNDLDGVIAEISAALALGVS
jgi:very-short-patch-repair endonuclease